MPEPAEIEARIVRLEGELSEAKERGDTEAVDEIVLQIRIEQHWLRKVTDDRWREFYEIAGKKTLDEWGKTGAK